MPHLPAALLISLDRPYEKQVAVAMALAASNNLTVITRCTSIDAVLGVVLARTVVAVVSALPVRDGGAIERAGADLYVARAAPQPRRRTVDRMVARLRDEGLDTRQIARALEVDPNAVRQALRKRFRPRKSPE